MDIKTAILHYYPYWILAILIVAATLRSEHKDLMRFQKSSLMTFLGIMVKVTLFRIVMMSFFPPAHDSPVLQIPLWLTLLTPWEDAVHVLPVILASKFLGDSKPAKLATWVLTGLVMISFGLGHVYESVPAAIAISFYIPIVSKLAKKHGVATVMAAHICYDFITLLTVRLFLGL